ncbi:malic enzyme [Corynebacterium halotolerans]|uniref:Malic enzyme n=1 Tax=Corynebacterium halotolerans YIM 70093 = DSM 44683 TaxID=1121362 RepID=M1NS10_9CORY|nr:malic enzyme [Corynebacterium halotolerans]AGF72277.1 malic enzyme [Corynebacterium halotolerans YIM 70093 = DSM 44683]
MSTSFPQVESIAPTVDHLAAQVPATAELHYAAAAATGALRATAVPERIQASYTTRFVAQALESDRGAFHLIAGEEITPQPGDVVVARVSAIRHHKRVETSGSRKAILFENNLVLLAYGHRYAADQFLAHVPDSLDHCHLVAAGGIAGTVTHSHSRISGPTEIEPLGLLADSSGVVNLRRFAPHSNDTTGIRPGTGVGANGRPEVIAVLGTAMNSGKSTTQACLVNGLSAAGRRVGAGKITGTGAGNDRMIYHDAGAHRVIDFTDFGYPTTFRLNFAEIRTLTVRMIDELATDCDVVIVEIADGIYQGETARLLRDELFQDTVDQVVFAATDALGAYAGVSALQEAGLRVAALAGVVTSSPLAADEARDVLVPAGVPVHPTFDLTDPALAAGLLVRG